MARPEVVVSIGAPDGRKPRARKPTSTARFGSSRRESHDASAFYERFVSPELSTDENVARSRSVDTIYRADARDMAKVESDSVALVVTSPPYFAGKEYEESLGANGVPGSYFEYLTLLSEVFAECKRVLEPGGRIAVNVANLGRRPYRSLAGDVAEILQDLGLLLRGEVVWWKGKAAGGSCAWGTFQRPANPVLRDVTERVVIASKGRFDRALRPRARRELGLPSTATISRDEFLEATTDLWEIPPESATRVNHPAPFPVELPRRLIDLYTYEEDVVLDPFMGSGTTAVAAVRSGRHFIGFDTDPGYCKQARARVKTERDRLEKLSDEERTRERMPVQIPAAEPVEQDGSLLAQALREGRLAKEIAQALLVDLGFAHLRSDVKMPGTGIELSFIATDATGREWGFDVAGAFTSNRAGLRRADTVWKAIGKAAVVQASARGLRFVLLTTDAPAKGSPTYHALSSVTGEDKPVFDVVELLNPKHRARLASYAGTAGSPS